MSLKNSNFFHWQEKEGGQTAFYSLGWRNGFETVKAGGRFLAEGAAAVIEKADEAISFFYQRIKEFVGAFIRRFFPGKERTAARWASFSLGVLSVCLLFLLEPIVSVSPLREETVPAAAPAMEAEPFDIDALLVSYRQKKAQQEQAGPLTVSVEKSMQKTLTKDALKNYEMMSAPAWFSVDLSQIPGSGSERAAYCHDYINSDVIGWIQVPGTNIDYPVLQGPDVDYYTSKDINKNYSYNGVIWVDADVNDQSTNTVLFGHNWTNVWSNPPVGRSSDVMFAQLPSFDHLWFAQRVPYFYYSNTSRDMVWQIFAVFYTTDLDFYLYTNRTGSALQSIIDKARRLSIHQYDVGVSSADRIITLSTCTRVMGSTEEQRFVVMAKLVSQGDSSVNIN